MSICGEFWYDNVPALVCKAFLVREENFEIYKVTQIQQFSPAN